MSAWVDAWRECCAVLASTLLSASCGGAEPTTAPAEQLVRALHRRSLETIAVRDPAAERRIVAARRFGRTQLTVLAGSGDDPDIDAWLAARRYDELYRWLLTDTLTTDAVVLHDLNGLGLRADRAPGHGFDIFSPGGGPHTAFDGDWAAQGLAFDEYCTRFRRAEQTYADLLQVLLTAVQGQGSSPERPPLRRR